MTEEDPRRIENFHSNILFFLRVTYQQTRRINLYLDNVIISIIIIIINIIIIIIIIIVIIIMSEVITASDFIAG